jgi:hypothetical protein
MKKVIVFVAAMWAFGAWASVSQVFEYKPNPGQDTAMYKAALEARAIQQPLGATVFIGTDLTTGNVQYVLTFADWSAWAAFGPKLQASKDWAAWVAKYNVPNPTSTPVGSVFVDTPVVAKTQPVGMVFSWKILPGKFDAFMAIAQKAVAIHNALGASAGINIDDVGNVHYELTFDSWASWAKFNTSLQKSPEWTALMKDANATPTGELMRVSRVEEFKAPK